MGEKRVILLYAVVFFAVFGALVWVFNNSLEGFDDLPPAVRPNLATAAFIGLVLAPAVMAVLTVMELPFRPHPILNIIILVGLLGFIALAGWCAWHTVDKYPGYVLPGEYERVEATLSLINCEGPIILAAHSAMSLALPADKHNLIITAMCTWCESDMPAIVMPEKPVFGWRTNDPRYLAIDTALKAIPEQLAKREKVIAAYATAAAAIIRTLSNGLPTKQEASPFTIPFADSLPNLPALAGLIVAPFWGKEFTDLRIGQSFKDTFHANRMAISTRLMSATELKQNNYLNPHQVSPHDAREYFAGTPFYDLFKGTAPFSFEKSRFMHQWIVAPQGMGKSTLLETMIVHDLEKVKRGECSIIVIDSQNTLIPRIAALQMFAVGEDLEDRLVVLEPDPEYPLACNLFDVKLDDAQRSPLEEETLYNSAVELIAFCLSTLDDNQADMFSFVVQLVMAIPGGTIKTLREILEKDGLDSMSDEGKSYRSYIANLDPNGKSFFRNVFDSPSFQTTTRALILRRVIGMLKNKTFSRMFSAKESKFNMLTELGKGKVILINTNKKYLKEDACKLFGRFFIAQLLQAVEMRGDALPVYCYVDECHDYVAEEPRLSTLLDQARKRNVGMILAHQRLTQITSDNVRDALANVDIQFASGLRTDSAALAKMMKCEPEDFDGQKHGEFMCFVKGKTLRAIPLKVPVLLDDLPTMNKENKDYIKAMMRYRYCTPRADVEEDDEEEEDVPEVKPTPKAKKFTKKPKSLDEGDTSIG